MSSKYEMARKVVEEYLTMFPVIENKKYSDCCRAYRYIKTELFNPGLSVAKLKEDCSIYGKSFPTKFRICTEMNPKEFIQYHRIECSKLILCRVKGITIIECAHAIGYSVSSTFTKAFQKHVGENPSEWRDRQQDVMIFD